MKLVRQPKGSSLCGQCCVATLTGQDLDDVIMVFRTSGRTNYRQVSAALRSLGLRCPLKHSRKKELPETAIVRFTYTNSDDTLRSRSHWVVWHKGKYYDPIAGVFRHPNLPDYLKQARITSHLPIGAEHE